jgi:hypothetical protein
MYGYGYRYPRVPRKVEALYEDPAYRFKWVRAAIGNRAVAAKSPWIQHLKESKAFEKISKILRDEAINYRVKQGGVKESTKKGAKQRIVKLQRAIEALKDQALLKNVASDLGNKYDPAYITASIDRLQAEINSLNKLLTWKPEGQEQQQLVPVTTTTGSGYGLLSGLGYGEGYGYFY